MENLIPVNYDAEQPTVSARDLHESLNIKQNLMIGFQECANTAFKMA